MKTAFLKTARRLTALFMALMIAIPAYPVYASGSSNAPEYIYDAGIMMLTCYYQDKGNSEKSYHNIWQASSINSYIGGEHALLATIKNKYGSSVTGINAFRAFQDEFFDNLVDRRMVNDYKAGEPIGVDYYYLAEGEIADQNSDTVTWNILAWPCLQGYSGKLAVKTEKDVKKLLSNCLDDLSLETQDSIPAGKDVKIFQNRF